MPGLLSSEPWIRLGIGASVFAAMAAWEVIAPRRFQPIGRWIRWPNNLGVLIIDTILLRLVFPAAAVGVALGGEEKGPARRSWRQHGQALHHQLSRWLSPIELRGCARDRAI